MEDIKVTSKLDLKTYFGISLLAYFKLRVLLLMLISLALISYTLMTDPSFRWWEELTLILILLLIYLGLIPFRIYRSCRKNMRKSAFLNEVLSYNLNEDKIELKGDTVSSSSNWQYISKMIEREKYFLLMTPTRAFYYLPKDGFGSKENISGFKTIIKEKGIKMTYN